MKFDSLKNNPWLLFSPLLVILIGLVLIFKTDGRFGDEFKYLSHAKDMLHGCYSPSPPAINLGNGPGYPILLMPFIAMDLPLVSITILNAFMFYLSIVLLYKLLIKYVGFTLALSISLFWAFYINAWEYIPLALSETFAVMVIVLIIWSADIAFTETNKKRKIKFILLSGALMGYLALTKPIFGYVLLVMLTGSSLLWIFHAKRTNIQRGVLIALLGLVTSLPYLAYTYKLTGKIFYWSTYGGDNFYWMTAPYKNEYGSWLDFNDLPLDSSLVDRNSPVNESSFVANHKSTKKAISMLRGVELDSAYKRIAINNIKSNPGKFMVNCFSNVGRILFNFPYSYKYQTPRTLLRLPLNGIILIFCLFSIIPTLFVWKKIPFSLRYFLFFNILYLGGSIFGSAETRMFTPAVPVLLFWIAFILNGTIRINKEFLRKQI